MMSPSGRDGRETKPFVKWSWPVKNAMMLVMIIPKNIAPIALTPDLLIGVPHNTKQKDQTRRYDESDYEYIPLVKADFEEMVDAGFTCFTFGVGNSVSYFTRSRKRNSILIRTGLWQNFSIHGSGSLGTSFFFLKYRYGDSCYLWFVYSKR